MDEDTAKRDEVVAVLAEINAYCKIVIQMNESNEIAKRWEKYTNRAIIMLNKLMLCEAGKYMETIEWIPCSERLPCEQDGKVLISMPNGTVTTGSYSEFSKTWHKGEMCSIGGDDPQAWIPMIKPYNSYR